MKGTNYRINIDALQVCYTTTNENIRKINESNYIEYSYFTLRKKEETFATKEYVIQIYYNDEYIDYATLKFSINDNISNYVFLKLNNKILYTTFNYNSNISNFIYYITEEMNLKFNNITYIEIAVDSNINFAKRIKKTIFNNDVISIINNKAINDKNKRIKDLIYIATSNSKRLNVDTVLVSNAEKTLSLMAYNKTQEIEDNHKEYINDYLNINTNIYRVECRIRKKVLNDFISKLNITPIEFYYSINNKQYLFDMFIYFSNRILRFKSNQNIYNVLQL